MTETTDIPAWVELIIREIQLAYPGLDADRLRLTRMKLSRYDSGAARAGWNEYLDKGGDEHFNLGRMSAIIFRIHDERRQRQDLAERQQRAHDSAVQSQHHAERIARAEKLISEMSAEEIAAEWANIEKQLTDAGRSVFKDRGPDAIRKSGTFKAHVAGMIK